MRTVTLVEWTDLLFHAKTLGFNWNYAHEILRVFQGYDRNIDVYRDEICNFEPMSDEYISQYFKDISKDDGDLNEMGRDIVRDFMDINELTEMTVEKAK